ncbi:aminotransferase class I/II-fold pyridoxal phosphate-dependent enzyme [Vibrio sp. V27_P1S3P104]|uniref:aminotransferase-like domain-containing protein n=1 Tax=unclassified Vibrio TaxID=2614977 RepID=UPI0013736B67|nr:MULTISPECIES: PLP-dependent aminotransferase family protein [unclassified Vibrio]NAW67961.1 aminotransferase class I/II-fold pyridoxal phosphate-dependent enzyme [Vibrio sp. V28_P6S34P95]NAX04707.1 aminotransferase class I/II-fold pyridoxal phosphate-dependent enzyme [Vibrio sp. V30_P3S12P165]NAX34659.1 aminotransferase class I/II-fold pyridoxal phosphate-dependent enzyme [Vibrio sp. V29_P1S30P107]NAX38129.1 aminotransferase class I/II-fold pyridoxal phosphate-dependent enzyme [Vibrio sp. V2
MAKYQQLVEQLKRQIKSGIWHSGDKLPSLRRQSEHSGLSLMTVLHAYQLLESQGWLISQPRSGYRVAPRMKSAHETQQVSTAVAWTEQVDINAFIFDVLQASKNPSIVNFGFAYPDPSLYPRYHVNRAMSAAARNMPISSTFDNLPPGNEQLRSIIAKRYAAKGVEIAPDEIIITAGALEALTLSLQACTRPGDWVVVESPTFYGALQSLERLGLKALSVRTDPVTGIDLDSLEKALQTHDVKACWLMSNCQNPLGFTLTNEKKQQLVELIRRYQIPIIEDDVYNELYSGDEPGHPLRMFDDTGNTMLCSSFSKSLIAGLRIGWVAAGKQALEIQKLQLMSTLATSAPVQMTLVHYLTSRNYESHLKQLRKKLSERKRKMTERLKTLLPKEVTVFSQSGGYFIWLVLPKQIDALQVYREALNNSISIAPGKMFSLTEQYDHCIRLNASFELNLKNSLALSTLSNIIINQLL